MNITEQANVIAKLTKEYNEARDTAKKADQVSNYLYEVVRRISYQLHEAHVNMKDLAEAYEQSE